jgi:hypothetical protein
MASPSKNYLTGDASRFKSTPTTCSPPNNTLRLSTIVSTDDALPAISYGRTPHTCMLTCTCDARCTARHAAPRVAFQQKLTHMHTPDILTHLICNSMDSWLARRPVLVMPARNGPKEPIQKQIRIAFAAQAAIGWDQFFRGCIAKAWRKQAYWHILQDPAARRFIHTGSVDANSH